MDTTKLEEFTQKVKAGDITDFCKGCREIADNGELEECMCGALASRDGHTYCRDCD